MDAALDPRIDTGQVSAAIRELDRLSASFERAELGASRLGKAATVVDDATRNLSRSLYDQTDTIGPLNKAERGYDLLGDRLNQFDLLQKRATEAADRSPIARSALGATAPLPQPRPPEAPAAEGIGALDDYTKKQWEEFSGGARGSVSTILKEISKGKPVGDALLAGARGFSDKLIDISVSRIFDSLFGKTSAGPAGSGLLGSLFSWLFPVASANGNVFSPIGLHAFADGGVVSQPTLFPFAGGVGLMGEAGPEAIMPLRRNSSGQLGVMAATGAGGSDRPGVIINNYNGGEVRERTGPDGSTVVDIYPALQAQLARDVAGGQGNLGSAIQERFGVHQNGNLRG